MKQHVVIIGGVASGPTAAVEARRTNPDVHITLIEKGPFVSYSACEMPLLLAGKVDKSDSLIRFAPHELATKFDIQVLTNTTVEQIDVKGRQLQIRSATESSSSQMAFDRLILATGASAVLPESLASSSKDVFVLRTLQDVVQIEKRILSEGIRHAVVIGAGYVGLDAASALNKREVRVTVLAPSGMLGRNLDPEMQELVGQKLKAQGIVVRKERATALEKAGDGRVIAVLTDQGEKIGCDFVLVAVGTAPNTSLAEQAGLKIGPAGGIVVDQQMQTSAQGIWACGDCTEQKESVFGASIRAPLSLHAFRSGRVAGRNAARNLASSSKSRPATLPPIVMAAAIGLGNLEVAHTGWTESMALEQGKTVVSSTIRHKTASAFTDHSEIHIKLIAETSSQRVIGAQIVGGIGAAQRINVVTALIRKNGTIEDLYDIDYVYSPPLAPSKDPLMVAARSLQKKLYAKT